MRSYFEAVHYEVMRDVQAYFNNPLHLVPGVYDPNDYFGPQYPKFGWIDGKTGFAKLKRIPESSESPQVGQREVHHVPKSLKPSGRKWAPKLN